MDNAEQQLGRECREGGVGGFKCQGWFVTEDGNKSESLQDIMPWCMFGDNGTGKKRKGGARSVRVEDAKSSAGSDLGEQD